MKTRLKIFSKKGVQTEPVIGCRGRMGPMVGKWLWTKGYMVLWIDKDSFRSWKEWTDYLDNEEVVIKKV